MRFFLTYLSFFPLLVFSQGLSFLDVSLEKVGTNVRVHWIVAAGNQCQDVEIQHSLDGKNFETVYTYAGICGDPNLTLGYDFTHQATVLNRANYYRIKVNQDRTPVLRTFINGHETLNVLTDFNTGNSWISFQNKGGIATLRLFDSAGRQVHSQIIEDAAEPILLPRELNKPVIIRVEQNGVYLTKNHL